MSMALRCLDSHLPKDRHLVSGIERADSLAFDLHKWMYLEYSIARVRVRDAATLHSNAFALTSTYIAQGEGDSSLTCVDVSGLSDYGFEFSRGFLALKAWIKIKERSTRKLRAADLAEHRPSALLDNARAGVPEP